MSTTLATTAPQPAAATHGPRARGTGARSLLRLARRLALVAGVAVLWELAGRQGLINVQTLPPPSAVGQALARLAASGDLLTHVWASLSRVFTGVLIASALGVLLGAALARFEALADTLSPAIELLRPISVIAWIPLAIIWFGLGDAAAWFLIALGAFFPVFTSTLAGIRQVPPVYVQAARTLGLGRWLFFTQVLWPCALPSILAGVRIGLGVGWMCVIAAEMIAAPSGLGYLIQTARVLIETELVLAGMVVIGIVGFAMNWLMLRIEHRLTPWLHLGR